jgi:hypothetical protein
MTRTAYCIKHGALEFVDVVATVHPFIVEESTALGPQKTDRSACEVRAYTDKGCSVHFIGGPEWNR